MNIPSFSQNAVSGKVSWFGGPHDPTDTGHTASGGSTREPGIAVYNRSTLGGYWKVRAANGKEAVLKQTDLGPAPFTGRKIDVTYSALGRLGYNEGNFPTDSTFSAQYLGMHPNQQQLQAATQPTRATGAGVTLASGTLEGPGTRGYNTRNFNTKGFEEAQLLHQRAKLIGGLGPREKGPVTLKGILAQKFPAPMRGEYETSEAHPGLPTQRLSYTAEIGTKGTLGAPGTSGRVPPGHELHGLLPAGAKVVAWNRKDQGRDVQLTPGQLLLATGNGYVIRNGTDPAGFGPSYPIVHLTSGPEAGKDVYYGHTDSLVKPGQKLVAGQPVARTSKTGHNAPPGWLEYGFAPGGTPGPFGQPSPF